MDVKNLKQKSVQQHNFSMNPRAPVPRSSFPVRQRHATTFSASYLIPIYLEQVNPGDSFSIQMAAVCRTAVPIVPIMDNWRMDVFFFYEPNRLLWDNWERFMGSQDDPGASISYTIPQVVSPAGGWQVANLGDYFGLTTVGQLTAAMTQSVSALPFRMYNDTWNQWFRDQNLQNSRVVLRTDGPDPEGNYLAQKRGKRLDYFTAALPFVQKGTAVTIPLGTSAPIFGTGASLYPASPITVEWYQATNQADKQLAVTSGSAAINLASASAGTGSLTFSEGRQPLYADLTTASAATINTLRTAIATQQLLERDARGGTRYVETVYAHWGVRPPDYRLDRPEYIGGGRVPVIINAIPQTSATGLTGGTTPAGTLAATGYMQGNAGFKYAATEHGYIMGLACVTADLTYSQGIRRHWNYRTRYDFPFPEFANLGEQAILNKEIYAVGSATGGLGAADQDMQVFGYIPRYDELRNFPSQITGMFRPTTAGNTAYWHTSQRFLTLPTLNNTFITDDANTVMERNFAGGAATQSQQFLADFLFTGRVARTLPTYAVPGLTRF